jgi:hypothetical protein
MEQRGLNGIEKAHWAIPCICIYVSPKKQLWTSVSHIRTEQKVARRLLFLGFYHQLGFLIRVHPPPHTASPGGILRNAGRSPVSDPWF